jgi:hypothetical protein
VAVARRFQMRAVPRGRHRQGRAIGANGTVEMDVFAKSLIVLGLAFVASGLVFVLPTRRKNSAGQESFEESRERAEYYLQQIRQERQEF